MTQFVTPRFGTMFRLLVSTKDVDKAYEQTQQLCKAVSEDIAGRTKSPVKPDCFTKASPQMTVYRAANNLLWSTAYDDGAGFVCLDKNDKLVETSIKKAIRDFKKKTGGLVDVLFKKDPSYKIETKKDYRQCVQEMMSAIRQFEELKVHEPYLSEPVQEQSPRHHIN